MDRIMLMGMRFEGRHGATEEERAFPQILEVDLEVEVDLDEAARTDELEDTIDYGPLVELVRRTVEGGSYHLLEAIAGAVVMASLDAAPTAVAVTVRVRKVAVPLDVDMDHAQVELRRERDPR